MLFTAYGFSISWSCANLIIGLVCGLVLHYNTIESKPIKHMINAGTIIISCVIGLLLTKTIIECNLYEIPFEVKIVKNLVAFASDTALMLAGYFVLVPIANKLIRK